MFGAASGKCRGTCNPWNLNATSLAHDDSGTNVCSLSIYQIYRFMLLQLLWCGFFMNSWGLMVIVVIDSPLPIYVLARLSLLTPGRLTLTNFTCLFIPYNSERRIESHWYQSFGLLGHLVSPYQLLISLPKLYIDLQASDCASTESGCIGDHIP